MLSTHSSLSLRRATPTLETLAYDCGNPVQYVCGHSPAVLFYLLDRHALLAMTRGSNCVFLKSLTTPGCAHPSNGGELGTYRRGIKFPSAEGWHDTGPRENAIFVGGCAGVVTIIESNVPERYHTRMPTATTGPRANIVCVGGSVWRGVSCKARRGGGNILSRAHAYTPTKKSQGAFTPCDLNRNFISHNYCWFWPS